MHPKLFPHYCENSKKDAHSTACPLFSPWWTSHDVPEHSSSTPLPTTWQRLGSVQSCPQMMIANWYGSFLFTCFAIQFHWVLCSLSIHCYPFRSASTTGCTAYIEHSSLVALAPFLPLPSQWGCWWLSLIASDTPPTQWGIHHNTL